jgi:Na+/melibiose symporter-like transporter
MSDSGANRPTQDRSALAAFRPTGKEIGALVCAVLPFVIFIGSTNRVVVNGQVVRDESFNLAGLILSIIAVGLVASAARELGLKFLRGPKALHIGLLALTGALALYQLVTSVGVI